MKYKKSGLIFLCFISFVFFAVFSGSDEKIVTLLYPPDKTAMEFNVVSVSLKLPKDSVTSLKVNVNNEEKMRLNPSREVFSFSVKLSVGLNKIDIFAFKEGKEVDSVSFSVFRRSNLIYAYKDPPPGFKKNMFHMSDNSGCVPCHKLEPNEIDKTIFVLAKFGENSKINPDTASTSSCFSCHKGLLSFSYVHNPQFAWNCLYCHDPEGKPKYVVRKQVGDLCLQCHKKEKTLLESKKYIHGPVNTGNCSICHNPHASDDQYHLEQPTWNLCVNCHIGKESGRHVVSGFSSDSHPTKGKPDPMNIGKELSCASCHNPHASDSPKLWQENARTAYALCVKCHDK